MTEEVVAQLDQIYQQARRQMLSLINEKPTERLSVTTPDWMSATQLAEYWQLYNEKREPTTAGILKWSKRPSDQFPLPHAYMGDLLRFNRQEVDAWAKQEAERRRAQSEKRRLKIA